jgi:lipid-A-disaccharide synthase
VPELLQSQVTPERLAAEANAFFDNPPRVSALRARFSKLHEELRRDASARAADAVCAVANID